MSLYLQWAILCKIRFIPRTAQESCHIYRASDKVDAIESVKVDHRRLVVTAVRSTQHITFTDFIGS